MTHSAGGLMQGDYITLWRNLYVDNSTRNNKVKGINHYANNIVYNWKNGCYIMGGDSSGSSYCIIEGNLFINGPVSSSSNALGGGNSDFHFYGADNWQDFNRNGKLDATCIDDSQTGGGDKVSARYDYPVVPLYPGCELLEKNLRKVGASLPYRDPNDCYMVDEVESVGKSGGLITYESSLAIGAPDSWTWYGGTKKTDSDNDGIPDSWEEANGLDKTNASDALWKASNGRLNIENYINSITASDRELYLRPPFTLGAVSDTTTTIKLTWRDYTYGEIGFLVEKKVNGEWQTVYRCQPNTNYHRVTGLAPGTYYDLRVRAVGLENGNFVYSAPAEIRINTRSAPAAEVDIDTYEPNLHLAEGQTYWDGTHRAWVERTMFADGNKVLLDTETTQKVNIQSSVKPESIVVNGTGDLTLNKVGNIGEYEGSTDTLTSINKGNTGSLHLIGAGSYLGKIINHEGTIWFNSIADGGTASSLGASPNDAQYWVFDGGSYIYNGSSASSNRNLEFRRTSGLGVSGSSTTLALSGAIEGDGDFVQVGDGTIEIADANTFFGSKKRGVRLEGGTLYLSTTGDYGSARNFANGNTVTNIVLAGGHVMFRSASEEYQTYSVPIQVEEGTSSQISLATHCYLKSRITGTGDLTLNIPYVRCFIDKDTKINAFEGNITANGTASGATFYHEGCWNCPNTRFNLTGTIGMVSKNRHVTCCLGGLSGDSGTELMGSDTKSSGSGTLWIVGSANSDETFAGTINDYNADHLGTGTTSVRKVGTGYWRLTGSSTLTGTTEVNEGTLIVDGTLPATSAVTVNSNGTLRGYGTINGPITVNDGGVLTSGDDALYGQYLCPKGNVTLLSGSTLKMPLFWSSTKGAKSSNFRPSTSATWKISTTATLELNVGNIEKFRVSANDKYYVFDSRYLPKFSGEFKKISPEQPEKGYLWDLSHLYTDGYVMIVADPDYTPPTRDFNPLKWKTGLSYYEAQTLLAGGYDGSAYVEPSANFFGSMTTDRNRYTALFDFVTYGPDGNNEYYIVPELSEEGEAAIKESAETILTAASESLASIASASGETSLNFTGDPIPGVYYSIKSGSSPASLTGGTKKQAGRGGAITLSFPHYDGSGFYSIAADLFGD
ncbi:MAG: fibronectin type III domain-containing protein [Kiritimatiellae bacterium]|nr:fibronectin type III domain-containing protein [Kiritimatiellia bacterium]